MKHKVKNSKFDLIWIIPEVIGGFGIIAATGIYLGTLDAAEIWSFIFGIGLFLVVFKEGLDWTIKGVRELEEALK